MAVIQLIPKLLDKTTLSLNNSERSDLFPGFQAFTQGIADQFNALKSESYDLNLEDIVVERQSKENHIDQALFKTIAHAYAYKMDTDVPKELTPRRITTAQAYQEAFDFISTMPEVVSNLLTTGGLDLAQLEADYQDWKDLHEKETSYSEIAKKMALLVDMKNTLIQNLYLLNVPHKEVQALVQEG